MTPSIPICIIRVGGHVDSQWSDWLGGLTISHEADGNTTLCGPVIDQAALHGLLSRLFDLGLTLISVNPGEAQEYEQWRS